VRAADTPEQRYLIAVEHAATMLWSFGFGEQVLSSLNELVTSVSGEAADRTAPDARQAS
jgi:hypothetical protein